MSNEEYLEYPVYRFLYRSSLFLKIINSIIFITLFYAYFFVFEKAWILHVLLFTSFYISTKYLYNNLKFKILKHITFINSELHIPKDIISNENININLENIRKVEKYSFDLFSKKRNYKLVIYTNDYKKHVLKWFLVDVEELYDALNNKTVECKDNDYPMIKHVALLIIAFTSAYTLLYLYYYKII